MAKLKDLKVTIGLSKEGLTKLNGDLRRTKANFKRNFGEIQAMASNMGRNLSLGVTAPLGLMAVQAVKAFDQQAKAIAQVEAGLQSTAGQVGYTSQQLQKMASDLQSKTLFGDEVILKDATAQLLTFTNIAGDNFARTQKVALDLATRLDGDLKSASIQLGKALNDPISNLTALSRAGIQFSADQKEVIKSLTESGRLAEAQTIILDELEKQYGGSAEAAAKAGTGPFKQLQNTLGDLSEEFGRLINEMIAPLIPKIQALVESFTNLSDRQKQVALTVAMIAASAGPLLLTVSALMKMRTAMLALNVVMAANPLGAVAAAAMLLVGAMATLKASIKTTREETESFIVRTKELDKEQQILAFNTKRRALETQLAQLQQAKAAEEAASKVGALGDKFDKQISTRNVSKYGEQIADTAEAIKMLKMATAEAQFGDGAQVGLGALPTPTPEQVQATEQLGEVLKVDVLKPMEEAKEMQRNVAEDILAQAYSTKTLKGSYEEMGASIDATKTKTTELSMAFERTAQSMAASAAMIAGAMIAGTASARDMGNMVLDTLAGLAIEIGQMALGVGIAIEGIKKALLSLNPYEAIAAGIALIGLGSAVRASMRKKADEMGVPMMAEGGLFTGPSLAMVGEGAGTSMINPEVVAPLNKLQNMLGGGNVNVTGILRGHDILLTNERSALNRNRVRGY